MDGYAALLPVTVSSPEELELLRPQCHVLSFVEGRVAAPSPRGPSGAPRGHSHWGLLPATQGPSSAAEGSLQTVFSGINGTWTGIL